MWLEIARYLPEFPSGVLTAFDAAGLPCSQRVHPELDTASQVLRFQAAPGLDIQPGSACLLCHRHDDKLWNLKSFVVQGELARGESGWVLKPERFIPGMGIGGAASYIHFVTNGRKNTAAYLKKRGLPRPKVNWEQVLDLMAPRDEH